MYKKIFLTLGQAKSEEPTKYESEKEKVYQVYFIQKKKKNLTFKSTFTKIKRQAASCKNILKSKYLTTDLFGIYKETVIQQYQVLLDGQLLNRYFTI